MMSCHHCIIVMVIVTVRSDHQLLGEHRGPNRSDRRRVYPKNEDPNHKPRKRHQERSTWTSHQKATKANPIAIEKKHEKMIKRIGNDEQRDAENKDFFSPSNGQDQLGFVLPKWVGQPIVLLQGSQSRAPRESLSRKNRNAAGAGPLISRPSDAFKRQSATITDRQNRSNMNTRQLL